MANPISRRDLITTAAAGSAAALLGRKATATQTIAPVAVASRNGLAATKVTVERMLGGALPVDAAVNGVSLLEADPNDVSVGYGGIPNEDGIVQLDAAVMDGTTMAAGAVAAIEGIKHPSQVAIEVMRRTTRVLLVGEGARHFARAHGFPEENLLTERARKVWLHWKANGSPDDDWLPDPKAADDPDIQRFIKEEGGHYFRRHGTVHISAVDGQSRVGCCTSTSGLYFKIPGRVGDSPLIGCGLYCDGEVGSAGATGHGESCIIANGAHTVVELMRQGRSPEQACLETLQRVARNSRRPHLVIEPGLPRYNLNFYAVNIRGEVGGASMFKGRKFSVCRAGSEPELRDAAYLFDRQG